MLLFVCRSHLAVIHLLVCIYRPNVIHGLILFVFFTSCRVVCLHVSSKRVIHAFICSKIKWFKIAEAIEKYSKRDWPTACPAGFAFPQSRLDWNRPDVRWITACCFCHLLKIIVPRRNIFQIICCLCCCCCVQIQSKKSSEIFPFFWSRQ